MAVIRVQRDVAPHAHFILVKEDSELQASKVEIIFTKTSAEGLLRTFLDGAEPLRTCVNRMASSFGLKLAGFFVAADKEPEAMLAALKFHSIDLTAAEIIDRVEAGLRSMMRSGLLSDNMSFGPDCWSMTEIHVIELDQPEPQVPEGTVFN